MNSFDELCKKLTQDVANNIVQKRSWKDDEQLRFDYAVRYLLIDLWKKHHTHPDNHLSIQKNKNFYSALKQYRDPQLTYRMAMHAFDGLQKLDMIYVVQDGYYDRIKMEGSLTRYKATYRLTEMFDELEGHPAITLKPNIDIQTILLRNKVDGRRQIVPYDEDKDTEQWRINLRKINLCFSKHILDLQIKDSEVSELQERLLLDNDKQPIDLTHKVLVRIFTNNSFKEGGRFYRGWWQNVPKEYRQFITIDSKKVTEYDFSQMNPNMIYDRYNHELGSEDAYSRVAGPDHRDIVKQAFNAMFQASTTLNKKPDDINDIDLDAIKMSWKELKEEILKAHKPIKDYFFKGLGNRLQFEDSCIAESVMLQFAHSDAPALPIHDSFIMHHGYGDKGGLEEVMRRAYFERFNSSLSEKRDLVEPVKHKIIRLDDKEKAINNGDGTIEVDDIINADSEYSQWRDRDRMWLSRND
jgi:hypothetical protein